MTVSFNRIFTSPAGAKGSGQSKSRLWLCILCSPIAIKLLNLGLGVSFVILPDVVWPAAAISSRPTYFQ